MKENSFEQSHDYWIDTAQILKGKLDSANLDDSEFDYPGALQAYENAVNEVIARKSDYAGKPMLEDQANSLIEEFQQKKKSFEEKFEEAY